MQSCLIYALSMGRLSLDVSMRLRVMLANVGSIFCAIQVRLIIMLMHMQRGILSFSIKILALYLLGIQQNDTCPAVTLL